MGTLFLAAAATAPTPGLFGLVTSKMAFQFLLVVAYALAVYILVRRARAGLPVPPIRKIPGLEALEESVGRATEMGRPLMFIPGIGDLSDAQTYAAFAVLSHTAKACARYDTRMIVTNASYLAQPVTEEIVRQSYLEAGRPEAYNPEDVRYLSGDQFAWTSAVIGIMHREKSAANIMVGVFAAEALLLAEAGHQVGAVQIAASTNTFQLPFFFVVCDYTLIGEEMYAAGAYLAKEPTLTGTVGAQDWGKMLLLAIVVLGTILETVGSKWLRNLLAK